MSKAIYLLTGATGHLGFNILKKLVKANKAVRTLVLPTDNQSMLKDMPIESVEGNVVEKESLKNFFDNPHNEDLIVIHCAGIVNIATDNKKFVMDVNFIGTQNIVNYCQEAQVKKMVYVSSAHAIAEKHKGEIMQEVRTFSPDEVTGLYAKTKAETSQWFIEQLDAGFQVVWFIQQVSLAPMTIKRVFNTIGY
ncbi:NAD-dependent epimerase/dehydratase family protein [endosymbiont 'TC1' of Trimyema compressum]|uniref:NAD-dependent epimerase/dehydratase family protein n=1 Tax=endosymbiont 'TC1' of Trimyema compressum TaxID=243899 RepID=UPI000B4C5226|nr:NAD-dependent epimerase/dehydratase family protein [endosymbiont 'TC1' of Trimyema compressum]